MSYYEVLLFVHIVGVTIWFGGGAVLLLLGTRLERAGDNGTLKGLFDQAEFLSTRVFIPSGLVVFVAGVLLVIEGPWRFGDLWVVLGLAGYAATFVTGLAVLKPESEGIKARLGREGMTAAAAADIRRLFTKMRIDYAVIAAVIADMTLKPTRDDIGALVAIAAIIGVVAASTVRSLRAAEAAPAARETA